MVRMILWAAHEYSAAPFFDGREASAMMADRGIIILVFIAVVVAASLFLDIRDVLRRLSDFRWRAKIKKNQHYQVLGTMLKDMESSGLIKLTPSKYEKPAVRRKTSTTRARRQPSFQAVQWPT